MKWMIDIFTNIIIAALIVLSLFFNKKVRLFSIFRKQFLLFRDARTNSISVWDIMCFIIFPLISSILLVFKNDLVISDDTKQIMAQIFASVFAILTGFMTVITSKINDKLDEEVQRVAMETGVTIGSAALVSLCCTIISIIMLGCYNELLTKILTTALLTFTFMLVMLMLMIIKRIYVLYY